MNDNIETSITAARKSTASGRLFLYIYTHIFNLHITDDNILILLAPFRPQTKCRASEMGHLRNNYGNKFIHKLHHFLQLCYNDVIFCWQELWIVFGRRLNIVLLSVIHKQKQ